MYKVTSSLHSGKEAMRGSWEGLLGSVRAEVGRNDSPEGSPAASRLAPARAMARFDKHAQRFCKKTSEVLSARLGLGVWGSRVMNGFGV